MDAALLALPAPRAASVPSRASMPATVLAAAPGAGAAATRRTPRLHRSGVTAVHARALAAVTALGVTLTTASCAPDDVPPAPRFEEAAEAAGIAVPLRCGGTPGVKETILEVNGNGVALADLDGDRDLDLVLVDGSDREAFLAGRTVTHHVLENAGPREGRPRFRPVAGAGLVMPGWPTGVTVGDVDRDGRPDLVIGGLGADALFLNRTEAGGPIRFERQLLPGRASPLDWTTSLALADADGDGRLDLYLARYLTIDPADPPRSAIDGVPCRFGDITVMCGPHGLPAQPDVFLAGLDGPPWFTEATAAAGLDRLPPSYGLGVLFTDLDGDGDPDLYVANDSVDNFVLGNDGAGTFTPQGSVSGAATDAAGRAQAGMGVDAADIDGDGDPDLVVTNFSDEANALYRNEGRLMFREIATRAGVATPSRPLLGWGVHLADLDADGAVDLFFANGHVYPEADAPGTGTSYAQAPVLQRGGGDGTFGPDIFPDRTPIAGRGSACGDLDGDGDLDLVVLVLDDAPRLFVNRTDAPERQLLVDLVAGGRDATGAVLEVETRDGRQVRARLVSRGFQSASAGPLHVGGRGPIHAAAVTWPGGRREALAAGALAFGRHVVVREGEGVVDSTALRRLP